RHGQMLWIPSGGRVESICFTNSEPPQPFHFWAKEFACLCREVGVRLLDFTKRRPGMTRFRSGLIGLAVGLIFSCSILGHAQDSNTLSPPLEVLKLKWEKQVRLPRNFDPSIIPTGTAFNDPSRSISNTPMTASNGAGTGTPAARTAGSNSSAFPATPGRLPVYYVYSL